MGYRAIDGLDIISCIFGSSLGIGVPMGPEYGVLQQVCTDSELGALNRGP